MSEKPLTPIEIGLTAAIVAIEDNEPLILTASGSDGDRLAGLPFGPFEAVAHRTFEIGLRESNVAAVMCAYNRVNGDYSCQNRYPLTDVLKKDWKFKGFVLSDWQGTHSTIEASAAGLDHEEPGEIFYGEDMKKAVDSGKVPMAELDDHVHRILRSMFAAGVIDDPPIKSVVDVNSGFEIAQKIEEQSIVMLKNEASQLPLDASKVRRIAVIGAHSDVGMISGGGQPRLIRRTETPSCRRGREVPHGKLTFGFRLLL